MYIPVWMSGRKGNARKELHTLLYKTPQSKHLRRTQEIARLMFQFCGMPFADFAHLEKSALAQGVLRYNRIKTGTSVSLEVLESSLPTISKLRNNDLFGKMERIIYSVF